MAYTSNPYVGKTRRYAVNDVRSGRLTQIQAARKYGVDRITIYRWLKRATKHSLQFIDTRPAIPHSHPQEIPLGVVKRVLDLRAELNRCAPVIHAHLQQEGIEISLASVGRILKRYHETKKKRVQYAQPLPRPLAVKPGDLVEVDTIHFIQPDYSRRYVYAVLDIFSRLGYAEYHPKLCQSISFRVIRHAKEYFGFPFTTVQTDHGCEFGQGLANWLYQEKIVLRHSRVRRPNDNAHIERFNRTLQDECLGKAALSDVIVIKKLQAYIHYYNEKRYHLALNCLTPRQYVAKVVS